MSHGTGELLKASLAAGVRATLSQPAGFLPVLVAGRPMSGAAPGNTMQYYMLWTDFEVAEISITLAAKFGNPDLFVSATAQFPNAETYTWRSNNEGSDTLVIRADDPNQRPSAWWVVGVLANGASAAYSLTYAASTGSISLQSNVPLPAQLVDQFQYKYYSAWVDSGADAITVAVTVLQGDADLYISFTETRPTADKASHDWAVCGLGSVSARCSLLIAQHSLLTAYY